VIADESAVVPADVPALAGCVDGINIKLSKCGGIREAYRMIAIARALDMKIMLGCMIESSLGIAAAAQLAPLVDYVDLDGHLLLAEDPFTGLDHQNGKLILSTQPGLGVSAKGSIAN
jgi:L-alanine-DL-glutamate epimerase-like enolase superfamily enzyme